MHHRLRPAQTSDFEWLLALERTSYRRYVEEVFGHWDDAEHRARFTRAFASETVEVVEVDDEPVGVLWVRWEADPIELFDVELEPRWQGRGLGTRLVHDVLRGARQRGRAVVLLVLRPNPARVFYERLGFAVTEQTATHVHMRWEPSADLGSEAALAPWADPRRRRVWAHRLFDPAPDAAVGFARFVAGRSGRPQPQAVLEVGGGAGRMLRPLAALGWPVTAYEPDPDFGEAASRVAAVAGPTAQVVRGGLGDLAESAAYDLALAFGGVLWTRLHHRDRVDAARRLHQALRPGGVLALEGPNMPWILKAYREPPPRTEAYDRASVSRITDHTLDFHDGVLEHRDTYVVESDDGVLAEWDERRRLALVGLPSIRLALEAAGFGDLETFRDLEAMGPARITGPRIALTARA